MYIPPKTMPEIPVVYSSQQQTLRDSPKKGFELVSKESTEPPPAPRPAPPPAPKVAILSPSPEIHGDRHVSGELQGSAIIDKKSVKAPVHYGL